MKTRRGFDDEKTIIKTIIYMLKQNVTWEEEACVKAQNRDL